MNGLRLLPAMAAAFALSGASYAQTSPVEGQPRLELSPCQIGAAGGEARCGLFRVPEDRSKPGGRVLSLKVVVLKAKTPRPGAPPVFFLTGGPGQAATGGAGDMAGMWERQEQDVVLMDLRGSGGEGALDCPPRDATDLQAMLAPPLSDTAQYQACRERLGKIADLSLYTTPISMQDLDELRQAMGYDKVDLEGGSYGTRAALAYIHGYGAHVHAAVLSGLSAFGNRSPLYHAAAAQRAFDRVAAQCEADPACRTAFPDVKGDLAAVLAELDRQPAKVTVKGPDGVPHELLLNRAAFAEGLRGLLYSAESGRGVPLMLREARAGEYGPFAQAALQNGYAWAVGLRTGLLLSVSCPEDVARIRPAVVGKETAGTFLGDQRVRFQMAGCRIWRQGHMPAGYFEPFRSDVPVLLVSGDLDPVTPPQWAEEVMRLLPNSLSLVLPGAHVEGGDCVNGIARQVLRSGSVKGVDTSCVTAIKLPPFVLEPPSSSPASPS